MSSPEEPADGGAASIDSWDDVPACTFDPGRGFEVNPSSTDTLRWYSYLSNQSEDGEVP
jgi:hypothetical protein